MSQVSCTLQLTNAIMLLEISSGLLQVQSDYLLLNVVLQSEVILHTTVTIHCSGDSRNNFIVEFIQLRRTLFT